MQYRDIGKHMPITIAENNNGKYACNDDRTYNVEARNWQTNEMWKLNKVKAENIQVCSPELTLHKFKGKSLWVEGKNGGVGKRVETYEHHCVDKHKLAAIEAAEKKISLYTPEGGEKVKGTVRMEEDNKIVRALSNEKEELKSFNTRYNPRSNVPIYSGVGKHLNPCSWEEDKERDSKGWCCAAMRRASGSEGVEALKRWREHNK